MVIGGMGIGGLGLHLGVVGDDGGKTALMVRILISCSDIFLFFLI